MAALSWPPAALDRYFGILAEHRNTTEFRAILRMDDILEDVASAIEFRQLAKLVDRGSILKFGAGYSPS